LFVVTELTEPLRQCLKSMKYTTVTINEKYRALETLDHVLKLKYEIDAFTNTTTTTTVCEKQIQQRLMWESFNSTLLYEQLSDNEMQELVQGVEEAITRAL
jgi:predicted nucleotidyltransferase